VARQCGAKTGTFGNSSRCISSLGRYRIGC
jgi:hypothetical protein